VAWKECETQETSKAGSKFYDAVLKYQLVYYIYVRPWIRFPVVLLIVMYLFAVSGNITTWRNNRNDQFDLRNWKGTPPDLASSTNPEDRIPFHLPDLFYSSWELDVKQRISPGLTYFVEATPGISVGVMVLALLWFRNGTIALEVFWMEIFVLFWNGLVQVMTSVPDSNGKQSVCWQPGFANWGSWIFLRISSQYCGDMIWSGHTYHYLFSAIILWRTFKSSSYPIFATAKFDIIYWIMAGMWAFGLIAGLILIRSHYSADIILGILITILVTTNRPLIDWGVNLLYRPNALVVLKPGEVPRTACLAGGGVSEREDSGQEHLTEDGRSRFPMTSADASNLRSGSDLKQKDTEHKEWVMGVGGALPNQTIQ